MNKKRNTVILIILVSAISLGGIWFQKMLSKEEGAYAVIEVEGREQIRLDLDSDTVIRIGGEQKDYNVIEVKNGEICVKEADCADLICVKEGKKSKNAEVIACLPHRMIITVRSQNDSGEKTDASAW